MGLRLGGERGLRSDGRGQTAPLGVALVMGIVIVGTASVLVFGGAALDDTQSQSELNRAEQIMTLFDSRTAMVALGDSDVQTTNFPGGGTHTVDGDAGRIRIVHVDYNGTNDETVYNESMGAVIFEHGDTEFAYQGGGVWRKERSGEARMVTPPEFHYRQSTLTFPLVRIANDDSAAGGVTAKASAVERALPIYPNRTADADAAEDNSSETGAPYDPVGASNYEESYDNPLENGSVAVWVESRYYEAWATYFRERTDAEVTTFDGNETVKANLVSLGNRGRFDMPSEGNGLTVRGLADGGHSLQNFSFTITDDTQEDNANLNNLDWSMYVDNGQNHFEIHLKKSGDIQATIYYSDDGGSTYEAWQNDSFTTIQTGDIDGDGDTEEYVRVDLTGNKSMEYTSISQSSLTWACADGTYTDPVTWDEHQAKVSWEAESFAQGDETTVYNVTAHYFEMMGDEFTLTVKDSSNNPCKGDSQGNGGNSVAESGSFGRLDYPGSGKYIAYLHVTENEVTVRFN